MKINNYTQSVVSNALLDDNKMFENFKKEHDLNFPLTPSNSYDILKNTFV